MAATSADCSPIRNLLIVLMLFVALAFATVVEGYLGRLSPLFVMVLAFGFVLSIWLSFSISTRRLLALLTVVFFMEYVDQRIGIAAGLWRYAGIGGQNVFGVLAWLLAACSAQALSTRLIIPRLQRLQLRTPGWLPPMLALALAVSIPLAAGGYRPSMGVGFACFLFMVGAVAVLAAWRMPIHVFGGVILSACLVGTISEYAGCASGCWSFPGHSTYPPFYLVMGCWPLEILAQFAISAWLAGEPSIEPRWREAPAASQTRPKAPRSQADHLGPGEHRDQRHHEDLSRATRQLALFLAGSGLVYLVVGFAFAILPGHILAAINWLSELLMPSLPRPHLPDDRFWVSLSFSMMMTIAALSIIGAATVRRNRTYAFAVLVAKLASTLSSLAYFVFCQPQLTSLIIVIVDGSIFGLTSLLLFRVLRAFFRRQTALYYRRFPAPRPAGEATVVVSSGGLDDASRCLEEVLRKTDFFALLERRRKEKGKRPEDFRVVIKPNFMFMHSKRDRSTFTDPALVEALVDHIASRGFTDITIVESQSTYGNYYANRDVISVAKHVGYRLDRNYKLVDLTKEMQPYDYGGRLGRHYVGPTWRDADFRISFAKNKTHIFCNYTLTLKNLYGTLPLQDKLGHYHTQREYDWPTIEALKHFPVDFALIDAFISADGQFGVIADPHPRATHTIIGGDSPIAVDWVGATKMGLDADDPLVGRFLPLAMQSFGKPTIHCIGGEHTGDPLAPYPEWRNVSRVLIASLDLLEEAYDFSNWWFSVLTAQDAYFAFMKRDWPTLLMRKLLAPLKRVLYPHDAL